MNEYKIIEKELENKDLKLYYIAQEHINKGELEHVYMHVVCDENGAEKWKERIVNSSIRQLGISKEDIVCTFYELIDNISNEYKVNINKLEQITQ